MVTSTCIQDLESDLYHLIYIKHRENLDHYFITEYFISESSWFSYIISLLGLIFGVGVVGVLETVFLSGGSKLGCTFTLVFSGSIGPY